MEAFKSLVYSRHSVRHFKPDPIPIETLRSVVELAEQSPSWCNSQPWDVYYVTGESLKKVTAAYTERSAQKAEPTSDIPGAHRENYSERGVNTMNNFFKEAGPFFGKNKPSILFDAPAMILLGLPKGHAEYMTYDLGSFGMLLQLAAKAYGLDTITAYGCVMYADILHSVLNIPESEDLIIGIAIGYCSESVEPLVASRLPVSDILTIKE